jgi:glutathione S-transferase
MRLQRRRGERAVILIPLAGTAPAGALGRPDEERMDEIILHHYDRSPFAEKIRVAFGLKGLAWCSVIQPRWAPKPELVPLTGGYRRIPVMQIGAEIFCDTRCILAELERRFPRPSLYPPGTEGLASMVAAWADRFLFADALGLVFALNGDRFPAELHEDRAAFTAGRFSGWDSGAMRRQLGALRVRMASHLGSLEASLGRTASFLLGERPSVADLAAYHPLWYARGNLEGEIAWERFPAVLGWMARVSSLGHGRRQEMPTQAALAIAREATPLLPSASDGPSTGVFSVGDRVVVVPDDWGRDPVEGSLSAAAADEVVLRREDPQVGAIAVHFPYVGFEITRAGNGPTDAAEVPIQR